MQLISLGNDHLFPLFCIGYELEGLAPPAGNDDPSWLLLIHHQAGGYLCSGKRFCGAILRLEANANRGTRNLTDLILEFRSIGEMSSMEMDFPASEFNRLAFTHGETYEPDQVRFLEKWLTRFMTLPKVERAIEGFVTFEACDPLRYFDG